MKSFKKKSIGLLCFLIAVIVSGIIFFWYRGYWDNHERVEVHAIDTECGGILLLKIEDKVILLGGAPEEEAETVLHYLQINQINYIDRLILQEPTEAFSGAYKKMIEAIPVKACSVFKKDTLDEATNSLFENLKQQGTSFETYSTYGNYKIRGLKIEPFRIQGQGTVTNEILGYNLYLPDFTYMWLPRNDYVQTIDWNSLEKSKPDAVNISGSYRNAFLVPDFLESVQPDFLILGDNRKVLENEKQAILKVLPKVKVIDRHTEGYSILYLEEGTYRITTFQELNRIIL